ncbi:gamma-glutamyl-gamma-aminobutyrate hydrolase family protein [Evansella sp. AB-rgal1]|uniref:gamma-glutamyl-gamma-aminobutyrate hydrolase family protein n=1 Tax=Evansella sp. AB-rgal1 TaxID=3242696 RepID=UPI00359E3EDE
MKKMIGITSNLRHDGVLTTSQDNITAITKFGGVPVVLPNISDEKSIDKLIDSIDGLLVTGGGDIDPTLFGEEPHPDLGEINPERDVFEMILIKKCLDRNIPILAICRGCQILNIAAGGDMYQDIYAQTFHQLLQHSQRAPRTHTSHFVEVAEDSLFHQIVQSSKFKVNSYHHQAVRDLADGFKVSAKSSDGIIEAFESEHHKFVFGIQWHPENLLQTDDINSVKLFKAFIESL